MQASEHRAELAVSASGHSVAPLSEEERNRLAMRLDPEERRILLNHGTEHPFCGGLLDNKLSGVYCCRLCGLPLFNSRSKFDSGTGWPSFYEPFDQDHISYLRDTSLGTVRTEIRCKRCDGHLGHVFPDGPPPSGLRYCLNSVAMEFVSAEDHKT
jgi:peptide-methionine (R)-S-oxide reductase